MSAAIDRLLAIMARLRDPQLGCPWDKEQSYQSIVPYTLEEAYEVADAIAREDFVELKDELGDLLFQVVFYAQIAKEEQRFGFDDCVNAICEKLVRRHPHVFGDEQADSSAVVLQNWEAIKAGERQQQGKTSVLDNVPQALPALSRAYKLQKRCAQVGFDWPDVQGAWDKVQEEVQEVVELDSGDAHLEEELGDLMFALVNVVRKQGFNPETVLRNANLKFERRFRAVEQKLAEQQLTPEKSNLQQMDALWDLVKLQEKQQGF
ncbi:MULTISPECIES: nucleoside triphosphate pyrophosphohydrolase [Rheinheimera]|uniref:Nucleoside triphosphate pyrophosphohydrolase n=1 Tax=Rheinheimera marina TaxID=1774958 RepID=A0ABV9JIC2_9GAMM